MATQFYISLQEPTIEIKVPVKDASGKKDSIVVGFKRYKALEGEAKMKELQEILSKASEDTSLASIPELKAFLNNEIVYLKNVTLQTIDDETGTTGILKVVDTRKAKPNPDFWGDADNCLPCLVGLYLESAPWLSGLLTGVMKAIVNNDFSEEEVKNS